MGKKRGLAPAENLREPWARFQKKPIQGLRIGTVEQAINFLRFDMGLSVVGTSAGWFVVDRAGYYLHLADDKELVDFARHEKAELLKFVNSEKIGDDSSAKESKNP